jgi:hypothetical protein
MPSYFSSSGKDSPVASSNAAAGVLTPTLYSTTIAVADAEQSDALLINTRQAEIVNLGDDDLTLAYTSGQFGTNYRTIPHGSSVKLSELDSTASLTLSFQSATTGGRIEIESWV